MIDPSHDFRAAAERALAFDWQAARERAFAARAPFYYVTAALLTWWLLRACRAQPLHRAALLGLLLFLVWLYPANYYVHCVFLLPLLAEGPQAGARWLLSPRTATVWGALCALCAAQYASVVEPYLDAHYRIANLMLAAMLVVVVTAASWRARVPGRG